MLGSPRAPVTLVEFADPQCPYCAQWSTSAMPEIVRDYVRTGKVRIEFHGMAFLGPDSRTGLAAAFAAARQNKLWNVMHLLYANQGVENAGWINDGLLEWIGSSSGVDGARFATERQSQQTAIAVDEATTHAQSIGVTATPTFFAGPTGGTMRPVQLQSLDAAALRPTLDQLLAS
jgi:protein-disulfide isomerase